MPDFRQKDIETPHLQMPFKLGGINGGAFINEQDSYEDVFDCIKALVAYPIGSNVMTPAFGIPDIVFRQRTTAGFAAALQQSLSYWEPRASAVVDEEPVAYDELIEKITIQVLGDN